MATKKIQGIKAVKKGFEIKPQGLKGLWRWAQDQGHEDYFNNLFNTIKNGERFKSAKYVGPKTDDIATYSSDGYDDVKGRIEITDTDQFRAELVSWLQQEDACDPWLYANQFIGLFSNLKSFEVPIEIVKTETATATISVFAKDKKSALKAAKQIDVESFKQRCASAGGYLPEMPELRNVNSESDFHTEDITEVRLQKGARATSAE